MSGNDLNADSLRIYSFEIGGIINRKKYEEKLMEHKYTKLEASKLLEEKIKEYILKNSEVPYDRAYVKVLELYPDIAKAYVMGITSPKKYEQKERQFTAGEEIQQMIDLTMLKFNVSSDRARDFVMKDPENEELVRRYIFGD